MNKKICPKCERENPAGNAFCSVCGAFLPMEPGAFQTRLTTRAEAQTDAMISQRGTVTFDQQKALSLYIVDYDECVNVPIDRERDTVVLGRTDPQSPQQPEVDLSLFEAAQRGVSRRHAMIRFCGDRLEITDLGSTNATYLNGLRLIPNKPQAIHNGDVIRPGNLKMLVTFK
jgi:hypothetical protein